MNLATIIQKEFAIRDVVTAPISKIHNLKNKRKPL
jgi:hypothetical protein